ncbi:hypothetical protein TTHMIC_00043 [Tetrahymena thermophila SB210]|uniref:Uncharacterized protein n=1 Tax=Tetrahymena thermophila (strain SB210) TaxID=312017 RepID=A0A1B9C287_TETTS|nr:hypothetical protein TTHMIC_00043 [Tetrahymena thermophila SB210]
MYISSVVLIYGFAHKVVSYTLKDIIKILKILIQKFIKNRVQVLYEAGITKAKTISNKTKIPYSSVVKRYLIALKRGKSLQRKKYQRMTIGQKKISKKVNNRVSKTKKSEILRGIRKKLEVGNKNVQDYSPIKVYQRE